MQRLLTFAGAKYPSGRWTVFRSYAASVEQAIAACVSWWGAGDGRIGVWCHIIDTADGTLVEHTHER